MDAQVAEASYVDLSTGLDSSGNIQHKGGSLDANWTVTGAVNPLDPPTPMSSLGLTRTGATSGSAMVLTRAGSQQIRTTRPATGI